ncbi:hypothetical protein NA57DRAFT_59653 [Rhizodiscina lignyota]|uniref:Uncharacterized protein n=1 Tax=Rhizodiscina lignyota TaxID=1504668 RepID=A0A9P4M2G8_9PEZI|nr:hypothetical protein NA57DRAFT_59653 [Rhizodiscina lignyota]
MTARISQINVNRSLCCPVNAEPYTNRPLFILFDEMDPANPKSGAGAGFSDSMRDSVVFADSQFDLSLSVGSSRANACTDIERAQGATAPGVFEETANGYMIYAEGKHGDEELTERFQFPLDRNRAEEILMLAYTIRSSILLSQNYIEKAAFDKDSFKSTNMLLGHKGDGIPREVVRQQAKDALAIRSVSLFETIFYDSAEDISDDESIRSVHSDWEVLGQWLQKKSKHDPKFEPGTDTSFMHTDRARAIRNQIVYQYGMASLTAIYDAEAHWELMMQVYPRWLKYLSYAIANTERYLPALTDSGLEKFPSSISGGSRRFENIAPEQSPRTERSATSAAPKEPSENAGRKSLTGPGPQSPIPMPHVANVKHTFEHMLAKVRSARQG